MGTSKSYGGPKGRTPLLPPWAPPPPPGDPDGPTPPPGLPDPLAPPSPLPAPPADGTPPAGPPPADGVPPADATPPAPIPPAAPAFPQAPDTSWTSAKIAIGKFASAGGGAKAFQPIARNFVRAQGGPRQATRGSARGVRTAQFLAGALTAFVQGGEPALSQFVGRDFVGRSADEVLAALVDELAPGGAQNEDAAARDAACMVLEDLFVRYSVDTAGLAGLTTLDMAEVGRVVVQYVATYIFTRLMQVLAIRLERNDLTPAAACRMERDIRGYVIDRVEQEVTPPQTNSISFTADEGKRIVERVFNDAYSIIEVWEE